MAYPLDAAAASPRPVKLGGDWWMVRPLPLWGLGMLYAFVADRGGEGLDREGFARLLSAEGMPTMLYAAIRPCRPSFEFEDAILLAGRIGDDEQSRLDLINAAFRRAPQPDDEPGPAETDWARYLWALARERDYSDAAGLSLDQAHIELSEGKCGEPRKLTLKEVQRMWDEANPEAAAVEAEAPPEPEVDPSIPPEGAVQVELNGITAWELPNG